MREGWEYKKLGDCFYYIKNGANIKQKKDVDGYPITRIETLSGGVFNRDRVGYAGIHDLSKYAEYILESKDLLMSHINSKTYIGRTVEYKSSNKETIIHGMNLLRLKANLNIIDSTFFAYYTQSGDFKSKIARIRKDAVNQSSFAISDLKRFDIPLPPKSTQLAIVSELDKINELIRLKEEQLKDFDNLAQSIFYEMFGDPVENEMRWEVNQLKDISTITSGYAFPSNDFSEDNPIKVVKITNVGVNEFVTDVSSLPLSYSSKESFKVKCGDIVIALTRTIISNGVKRALVPQSYDGALLNQRVAAIAVMHSCTAKNYIYQLLGTSFVKQYIESHATALNQPNLSITDLKRMPIPLPPLPLQQLFAHRIEQIEHQKAEVQKAITDLETLLASRMQYWFE